ncbi:hypothetical protein [Corynebacterium bovis]|uniref:hypothetical protein n=1 Tax=Corynebacterium bovis TaxID=36808 RepID=UPI001E29816A|nr:hypothetical protein [Corynebacterium bovis]
MSGRPSCCIDEIVAGSCLAQLRRMPSELNVMTADVPPAEMSGSWMPVIGTRPRT